MTLQLYKLLIIITFSLSFSFPFYPAFGQAPRQLNVLIDKTGGSCPQSIAIFDGLRLTLQFPSKVRVAVPSHDHMLDIFISGRLIVINPSQKRRKDRQQVTLTTELSSHQAFICQFEIFDQTQLREHNKPLELIRVQNRQAQELIEAEAIELLSNYIERSSQFTFNSNKNSQKKNPLLTSPNELSTRLSSQSIKRIESWQKKLEQESIQKLLLASDFQVSSLPPLRAQENLIYIVIERVIRSQQNVFLRVKLRNRSQAMFELKQVKYSSSSLDLPNVLWSVTDQNQLIRQVLLKADEEAKYLSLKAPLDLLDSILSFISTDGRSIQVDMRAFNEFD